MPEAISRPRLPRRGGRRDDGIVPRRCASYEIFPYGRRGFNPHLLEFSMRCESPERYLRQAVLTGFGLGARSARPTFWKQVHFERKSQGEIAEEGAVSNRRRSSVRVVALHSLLKSSATGRPRRPTRAADSALWRRVGLRSAVRRVRRTARRLLQERQIAVACIDSKSPGPRAERKSGAARRTAAGAHRLVSAPAPKRAPSKALAHRRGQRISQTARREDSEESHFVDEFGVESAMGSAVESRGVLAPFSARLSVFGLADPCRRRVGEGIGRRLVTGFSAP